MGADVLTFPVEVPLDVEEQIDRICVRFEQLWQVSPGPALRPLLHEVADNWQPILFRELLKVELDYRLAHRENPRLDDYIESYPEFADLVRTIFPRRPRRFAEVPSQARSAERVSTIGASRDGLAVTASSANWAAAAWGWSTRPCRLHWTAS